jgi:hypothetical protein
VHPARVGGRPRGQARDDPSDDAHNRLLSQRRILACAVVGLTWQIATGGENLPGVLTVPWSVASLPAPVRVREKIRALLRQPRISRKCSCLGPEQHLSDYASFTVTHRHSAADNRRRAEIVPGTHDGGYAGRYLAHQSRGRPAGTTGQQLSRAALPAPPPGGLPRDGQLLGLRCLTRDLRVHAEVVERARNNCQSDRACPDAARDRPLK